MRCEYRNRAFLGSNIFNPLKEPHVHDGTDQCWMVHVKNDVTEFVSPNGQEAKRYCLFHAHHAPEEYTQTKWDKASLGKIQATRLKELLDQWNDENERRKINNETLLTFALPGMQCGYVDFKSYTFRHNINFSDATFSGNAEFKETTFSGDAWFDNTMFSGNAMFGGATFSGDAWFDNTMFSGNAMFYGATFSGEAMFDKTTFSGEAMFATTTFSDKARFDNARFNGHAWFNRVWFSGNTRFESTTFSDAFSFNEVTCSKSIIFSMNLFSSDVSFIYSKFHNTLIFQLAKIERGGRFVNCLFNSFTYQTHIGERLLFNHCKTDGKLNFTDQDCSRLAFLNMDVTKADFLGADVSKTRFDACQWKEKGGPKYATVYKHGDYIKPPLESPDEKIKKENDEDYKDRVSKLKALYRQLMKNLEENREYKQAGDFHYQEMELRRKMLADGLADSESLFERPMLWLYRAIADFGENYVKLGVCLIVSWLYSAGLIWSYNLDKTYTHILGIVVTAIIPGWPKPETVVQTVSKFSWLWKGVLIVEAVIALILTALFAMAVNRRFRR